MAGQRQPIELLLAKGKKHLTKSEIEERKKNEVKAPSDKVKAPSYLSKELKKEFNKIATQLKDIGIITNLDINALSRYVISEKLYIDLTKQILENPSIIITNKDIVQTQDKFYKQCRSSANDLGLTISSRCKLVIPKKEETKEKSEEEKLFGDSI